MDYRNIGSRLLMAASLVEKGKAVCDVGCDHGKLSLYLIKETRAQKVIATDINEKPLQKAIQLFCDEGMEARAQFFLTDGLQAIGDTADITHVVIAGLGGETISRILSGAGFIKHNGVQLVLLPAQSGAKLRRFLFENGFSITGENTVAENKKFYSAISASYTAETIVPTIFDCYIGGSKACKGASAIGYFKMVLSQLEKRKKGQQISCGTCDKELQEAIEKTEKIIEDVTAQSV